jgi:hypothetical protein
MAYQNRHHRFGAGGEQLEPRLALAAVAFIPHDVSEQGPLSVAAADMDGDNDTDLVIGGGAIWWYQNINGKGAFGPPKVVASQRTATLSQIEVADLDNDGDMDVVANTSEVEALVWYENVDGQGTFGAKKTITVDFFRPAALSVADMDGDADLDVLGTFLEDDAIVWFENVDGRGIFGPGTERIIASEPQDDLEDVYSVTAADLDSDGDIDVLVGAHGPRFAWYENTTGGGTFGPRQLILTSSSPGALGSVAAADVDGDGDIDALAATDAGVFWYENTDGRFRFGTQKVISDRDARFLREDGLLATDVDTDGDLDVLYMSAEGGGQYRVVWHENTDGRGAFGRPRHLATGNSVGTLAIADVDGDGDQDVISIPSFGPLTWYENDLRILGDANGDDVFNQLDIVQVLQAGKFRTGEPATWDEGDWNADAVFDQLDIVAALQDGNYDPA